MEKRPEHSHPTNDINVRFLLILLWLNISSKPSYLIVLLIRFLYSLAIQSSILSPSLFIPYYWLNSSILCIVYEILDEHYYWN